MHLKYAVPAGVGEERLWVQFHAGGGAPFFSVEARYEHPKETLDGDAIASATAYLKAREFGVGNDGWGSLLGASRSGARRSRRSGDRRPDA
jgi:hypothetical protein